MFFFLLAFDTSNIFLQLPLLFIAVVLLRKELGGFSQQHVPYAIQSSKIA